MQTATLIYNDRVVSWKRIIQIEERMDTDLTRDDIFSLVRLRIRNLQAFSELQNYNDTGLFLFHHPLINGRSERAELISLLEKDPQAFLRKHRNVLDNIRRYETYLKSPARESRRKQDRDLLRKHRDREMIFRDILNEKTKT